MEGTTRFLLTAAFAWAVPISLNADTIQPGTTGVYDEQEVRLYSVDQEFDYSTSSGNGLVLAEARHIPQENSEQWTGQSLFLTWQRDPTTTMTIDWHTYGENEPSALLYRKVGSSDWGQAAGAAHPFPFSQRTIHRVELTGLEPDTLYAFKTPGFERVFQFRTMPKSLSDRPVVFAAGGDTRHSQNMMEATNRRVMQHAPDLDFIVWGGDLAYADGQPDRLYRWYEWFDAIMNTLITEEGRVVPIVVGIGNHEVRQGYWEQHGGYRPTDEWRESIAPYFYRLFAFPGQPGYGVLDFGRYLSLILLDTDHSGPIVGEQTNWLKTTLEERDGMTHIFPVYHVAAFPSHREFNGTIETRIRTHWVPLFEQNNLRVAFENHDHTYKRTVPIRENVQVAEGEGGIVYLGDGAWGVDTRSGNQRNQWWIQEFSSSHHAIIVTLTREGATFETVMPATRWIFDRYEYGPRDFTEWAAYLINDPAERSPEAVLDGRVSNLMKYAMGMDPGIPAPLDYVKHNGTAYTEAFEIKFNRNISRPDLVLSFEISENLKQWTEIARAEGTGPFTPVDAFPVEIAETEVEGGGHLRSVTLSGDSGMTGHNPARLFLRLRASLY